MSRADNLIRELSIRHGNTDARFLTAVRPLVARILDDGTPEAARVPLLEMLAETFERDVRTRRDCASARAAWARFCERLQQLLRG